MLPIRAGHGAVVAFIGRAAPHAAPEVPKYLNSPTTPLYGKRAVLFGLWEARTALAAGATPVIAEGPLDVIAIAIAGRGRYAPLAPCGTALTAEQVAALGRACDLSAREVMVAFDADRAGRRAAIASYQRLSRLGAITTAVTFPAGRDPAQVLRDHGPSILAAALAQRRQPLADLVIDAEADNWQRWLSYPEGQIGALRAAARVIAAMQPDDVGRQVSPAGRLARPRPRDRNDSRHRRPHRPQLSPKLTVGRSQPPRRPAELTRTEQNQPSDAIPSPDRSTDVAELARRRGTGRRARSGRSSAPETASAVLSLARGVQCGR